MPAFQYRNNYELYETINNKRSCLF